MQQPTPENDVPNDVTVTAVLSGSPVSQDTVLKQLTVQDELDEVWAGLRQTVWATVALAVVSLSLAALLAYQWGEQQQ